MSRHPQVSPSPALAVLALYDQALPQVYGYLLSRCDGQKSLAEDLTSETFLAAVKASQASPPPEISTAWLIGVARHKLVDHWRRREREERSLRMVRGDWSEHDDPWDIELDAIRARDVLSTLGAHHQAALTLRYVDGLAVRDVADHLDRTVRATEALLARARAAFRRAYEEAEEGLA